MPDKIVKFGLYGLGIACALIGLSMAIMGSSVTAAFFNRLLAVIYDGGPINDLAAPNIETELRFYGVMFFFYGAVLIQTVRDLRAYSARTPYLLGIFFLAGLARLNGYFTIGAPHMLFTVLMGIELTLPVCLFLVWKTSSYN